MRKSIRVRIVMLGCVASALTGCDGAGTTTSNRSQRKASNVAPPAGEDRQREVAEHVKRQVKKDIAQLEAKKAKADEALAELAKLKIEKVTFGKIERYRSDEKLLQVSVENGTGQAISKVTLIARVEDDETSDPPERSSRDGSPPVIRIELWKVAQYTHTIPGGMQPGAKEDWVFKPRKRWTGPDVPEDFIPTVEITRIIGVDGKTIAEIGFTKQDARRLEKLQGDK